MGFLRAFWRWLGPFDRLVVITCAFLVFTLCLVRCGEVYGG